MATSKTPRTKPLKPTEVKDPTTEPEGTDVPVPSPDVPRDDARTIEPETTSTDKGDPAPEAPTEDELTKAFNEPPEWIAGGEHKDFEGIGAMGAMVMTPEEAKEKYGPVDISAGPGDEEPDDEPGEAHAEIEAMLRERLAALPDHRALYYREDGETLEVSLSPIPEWQPTETGEEYSDRLRARNHFLGRLRVAIDREQFYLDDTLKSTAREIAAQAARGNKV